MKTLFLYIIRLYQKGISPFLSPHCRFYPTCSEYSYKSIEKHGLVKGLYFSIIRLAKCHPYHEGGFDPVK